MTAMPDALGGLEDDGPAAVAAPQADPSAVVARLNSLLRGELAAAETYQNVVESTAAAHPDHADRLRAVQAEHARSVGLLRGRIADLGGTPVDSSGLWGVWASTVQGALTLFGGEAGGLRALREGEDHGLRDYETALNEVDAVTAQLIQDRLLPAQQRHLVDLDEMLASAAK